MSSAKDKFQTPAEKPEDIYDDGHLRVEHRNHYVSCGGTEIRLSRKEFLIASILTRHAGHFVSAKDIWRHAWHETSPFNGNTFKVQIHRLRRRLLPFGVRLENELQTGYRFMPAQRIDDNGKARKSQLRPPAQGDSRPSLGT